MKKAFAPFLIFFLCGFKFLAPLDNEKGNHYYKKGQVGKAQSAYSQALKADPASHPIAFNLGNTYYKEEAYDRSAELYQKSAHNEKDLSLKAKAFYNSGNSLAQHGETEKAIEFYKESLRINPKDQDAKYNLELLLHRQDNKEKKQQKQDKKQDPKQQKNDQKNQGGGGGGQSSGDEQQKSGQEKKEQGEGGQQQKQQGNQEKQDASSGGEQEKKDDDKKQGQQSGSGDKEQPEEKRQESPSPAGGSEKKSESEKRAEQILNALSDHEQQVLKLSGDRKTLARPRRISEEDW